ncbi:MAG: ATP-dependent helicase [Elainellaceae cyanobacterium]
MPLSSMPPSILERSQRLQQLRDRLRLGQRCLADWQSGPLAVSAVPGSGKSTGMAIATALLLGHRHQQRQQAILDDPEVVLPPEGQVVLVTFTRSAAANLKVKIRQYLQELALPAQGFVVHTLHGLALSIANRHPNLSGLNLDQTTLISPNQHHRLLQVTVEQWIAAHPQLYQQLLEGRQFDGEETERLRRQSVLRTEALPELAQTLIHEAKSSGLSPADLDQVSTLAQGGSEPGEYDLLAIAAGLYEHYQTSLRSRYLIDYDDMILAALAVLDDPTARSLWQSQIFAVFEDEAQDSSPLQTRLLNVLAARPEVTPPQVNLVRVGDPNQAINSTFTPADPIFFRQFCQDCDRQGRLFVMDQAGRSTPQVMKAANAVLTWANQYLVPAGSVSDLDRPFQFQLIRPVDADDPQANANPTPLGQGLELCQPSHPEATVALIAQRVAELAAATPNLSFAVLVRDHRQGRFLGQRLAHPEDYGLTTHLEDYGISLYDVGQQERQSHVPQDVLALLQFIDRPHSPDRLKAALKILTERQCIPNQDLNAIASFPEQFLYPGPLDPPQAEPVRQARRYCTGLLRARLELPQHQIIPFLALTLGYSQSELATADKLAERLAQQTMGHLSLGAILGALTDIVSAERFEPVDTEDADSRYTRSGQLTIMTMHKAKGLDWDVVFLPFLHADLLPGSLRVMPQTQFLGDFTLAEVARTQLRAHLHQDTALPTIQAAWKRAIALKPAEDYRLLYVAMTRAKRLLWMSAAEQAPYSWSNVDNLNAKEPCPALTMLQHNFPEAVVPCVLTS